MSFHVRWLCRATAVFLLGCLIYVATSTVTSLAVLLTGLRETPTEAAAFANGALVFLFIFSWLDNRKIWDRLFGEDT